MKAYLAQVFDTEDKVVFDVFHLRQERAYELMREHVTTACPIDLSPEYYAIDHDPLTQLDAEPLAAHESDGYFPEWASFERVDGSGEDDRAWGAWGEGLMRVVEITIRED